jgi:hypothetical protein
MARRSTSPKPGIPNVHPEGPPVRPGRDRPTERASAHQSSPGRPAHPINRAGAAATPWWLHWQQRRAMPRYIVHPQVRVRTARCPERLCTRLLALTYWDTGGISVSHGAPRLGADHPATGAPGDGFWWVWISGDDRPLRRVRSLEQVPWVMAELECNHVDGPGGS